MARATLLLLSFATLCSAVGCGGSSSETPFPPEPLDVNLEAEDMATADPYRAARPGPPRPAETGGPKPGSPPSPSAAP